jgi:hypothetical protein
MKFHKNPSVGSVAALCIKMDITRLVVTTYFANAPKSEFKKNNLWSELDQDGITW